ncbi:MAG: type II toxin-antitoxin system RelE/ParE family toxin [Magnetococcales bacterium]|nr:type II toxin-antitoxin system RelE/ParE family toxin [Magnetococcales bacterium]
MTRKMYRMTATAEGHFWKALRESRQKWGHKRAEKYRVDFLQGLQRIADNHPVFNAPHRDELAADTAFLIHLVEHRYVAFQEHDKETIIIAGIFHESMDIPTRLRELQGLVRHEIDALKREIDHVSRHAT